MAKQPLTPRAPENPIAGTEDTLPKDYQRASHDLLYESIMHGGGEPFGNALGAGTTSLTARTVKRFRKRGFFFMSTYEPFDGKRKNPFSRAGATTFHKDYPDDVVAYARDPAKRPRAKWWRRLLGLK